MRGYFAIGVEGISKAMNLGAIMRTGHAFGASFVFTVNAAHHLREINRADTSRTLNHVPYYDWETLDDMALPKGCQLVGVELTDDAIDLPTFKHPKAAAYVLGRERGSLSPEMQERCSHIVKIPTKFCVNVSVAGALTLYDRTICMGGYPKRPIMPGGPQIGEPHTWGPPKQRRA
ncbi:RNA methyltransferase [Woodsholea maritima]|uniref:RNA methyltransferase n=1 Tax=Woodsholea maritima TaxID=240237 RepID=UPI000362B834|nr:RNA methyltransferase [Woodsholea maritima]